MKITPTIKQIADSVNAWGQIDGWKTVGVRFSDEYQRRGGGALIPPVGDEQGIKNAVQRVKRIFGLAGPRYVKMASQLTDVALNAMPKRRRMELEEPESPALATANAMEAYGAAMAALAIRCPTAINKLNRAMEQLQALVPIAEILIG